MRRVGKRGAEGTSIAVLVSLLALFILLYVLLLPPEDRDALLNQTYDDNTSSSGSTTSSDTLLLESPGNVYPSKSETLDHELNPINLFLRNEPKIDTLANSLQVYKSLFSGNDHSLRFNVDDLDNIDNSVLSFVVKEGKGKLMIELNGNLVSSSELSTGANIITLPVSYLTKNNDLKIYVSSPGIAIFSTNKYVLEQIKVKQEYELVNSKESRGFTIPGEEKDNLRSSKLTYFFYCNDLSLDQTLLRVYLNDKVLEGFPQSLECSSGERDIDLDIDDIKEGKNTLMFVIDDGDFSFTQVKIENKLREKIYPLYYFFIDSDDFDDVTNNNKNVIIRIDLNSNNDKKTAEIRVNDEILHLDTREDTYSWDISDYVEKGENLVKIIPITEFEIHRLKISLEDE